MRILSVLLGVMMVFAGTPVLADPSAALGQDRPSVRRLDIGPVERFLVQSDGDSTAEMPSPLDTQIADLRRERAEISTRGPRTATIVGGVMTGVGALVAVSAALACASADSNSGTECKTDNATALEIGGGAFAAIGLVTLISGVTALNRRRASQRAIDQKIRQLKRQDAPVSERFDAHIRVGERTMLALSWRF